MCENIIACVSLTLLLPPSFSPLLCFCSTLCLSVMPMVFFMSLFPFFLPSFPFLFYSGFSFFTFLFTYFSSRLVYNFCFVWLLLSLTRLAKHPVNLSAHPKGWWPENHGSCALNSWKKGIRRVGAALISLLSKWFSAWMFWFPLPALDCSCCGWVAISQI